MIFHCEKTEQRLCCGPHSGLTVVGKHASFSYLLLLPLVPQGGQEDKQVILELHRAKVFISVFMAIGILNMK